MKPTRAPDAERNAGSVDRRKLIAGTMATGVAAMGQHVSALQSTPEASPVGGGILSPGNVMTLSANVCSGAILNPDHVGVLISHLEAEADIEPTLDELMAIPWFTSEELAAASPEAQRIAKNILQYWFLGRYDGELVENRTSLFFDMASWQSLPYMTQQSACKPEFYWAEEIDLEAELSGEQQ